MRTTLLCIVALCALARAADPNSIDLKAPEIKLWPNGAPGSEGVTAQEEWIPSTDGFHRVRNIHQPSMTVFLPPKDKATGVAYVICPGRGPQLFGDGSGRRQRGAHASTAWESPRSS